MTTYATSTITITDTGKRRTSSVSAEETDIVNSGSSISLHGIQLSLDEGALLNKSPAISLLSTPSSAGTRWAMGEIDLAGIKNSIWTIAGVLNLDSSTDRTTLNHLRLLTKTKGYKILGGDIPDLVDGADDNTTINVHVSSFKVEQQAKHNILAYTLTLYETA